MRYAPPGLVLNDFAVLPDEGGWHLLHLQASPVLPFDAAVQETSYGHAYSTDLLHWEPRGEVFGVAPPGRFDDGAVWTMSTVDRPGGGLAMLYTGVCARPHPATQAIGLAYSPRRDGTGWRRLSREAVCTADPRWYRTDRHQAWRDPYVVRDPARERWVMFVAARRAGVPPAIGGCIGVAVSTDLQRWTVLPPLVGGRRFPELECPVVERVGGRWWMFVCVSTDHSVDVYSSDDVMGPYVRRGRLAPPGVYAPRLLSAPGGPLVLHTVQRRAGLRDDGALVRGMLAQPKRLELDGDGVPFLAWWPPGAKVAGPRVSGMVGDALVELSVPPRARTVVVTLHDAGARSARPVLQVRAAAGRVQVGYPDGPVLQDEPLAGGELPAQLRVLVVGEFHEVYADDRLVLSAAAYACGPGEARACADGLAVPVVVRPLPRPYPERDDVSAI